MLGERGQNVSFRPTHYSPFLLPSFYSSSSSLDLETVSQVVIDLVLSMLVTQLCIGQQISVRSALTSRQLEALAWQQLRA